MHKIKTENAKRLLDKVNLPKDIRKFNVDELKLLADELRHEVIDAVSKSGGHLGAGLGVVELTIALHYVFNTPVDKLIWDVGHQSYPHKILTGRKHLMHTLRKSCGIAGFPKRGESEYDALGVGHSSTSISAALGMAVGRDLKGEEFHHIISVIGDGALSAGIAYEAMNNAGFLKNRMIVILNDNKMSIAPAVGAMTDYLNRMMSSSPFLKVRNIAKNAVNFLPTSLNQMIKKTKRYAKDLTTGGNFFEEIGFHYVGPVDGHNLEQLIPILQNCKNAKEIESPILIHVKTTKGKGFDSPESCAEKFHAVKKFDLKSKMQHKQQGDNPSYTSIFADALVNLAEWDDKVIGITAAMPSGTGIDKFAAKFPSRAFDVGIAEQHAVTFAAGLAIAGMKPFVAIYSTFLQRAYDQVVHDVAIQKLPVRFIIDRAGLVGGDGPTHAGSFDIAYLGNLPNMVFMAPSDDEELARAVATAHLIDNQPSAIRFPRGSGMGMQIPSKIKPFSLGKGRIIHESQQQSKRIAILSLGTRLQEVKKAQNLLKDEVDFTIADARFIKPLDTELIKKLAQNHDAIITIEEGSSGGFGAQVFNHLNTSGLMDKKHIIVRSMHLPDTFIEQGDPYEMYEEAGLNAQGITSTIKAVHSLL